MSGRLAHRYRPFVLSVAAILLAPTLAFAQSPWERAANNLALTFTGPLARSLALVAIVIGGLLFMFGEAGAKRQISGIVFGGGLALFAAQFLTWLFLIGFTAEFREFRACQTARRIDPFTRRSTVRSRCAASIVRLFFLALIPRRRHLQPLLLVPRRAC
jgi:type IV secretory pathway VirB2 component (pilin)